MESLNKQQIILVTLLVSFVTSIATGIVTVALYDQAPKAVTQTINRVVERTVERVVTEPARLTASPSSAPTVTKETIVIREDDRVTDAVAKNTKSIVRLKQTVGGQDLFVTLGLIISSDGTVAVYSTLITSWTDYIGFLSDGNSYKLKRLDNRTDGTYTFFKLIPSDGKSVLFDPVKLVSGDAVKLGQSIVSLSGESHDVVSTGLVQSLLQREIKQPSSEGTSTNSVIVKSTYALETNIRDSVVNSPLLNLSGEVIGVKTPQYESAYIYSTTDTLQKEFSRFLEAQKPVVATSTATTTSK
jgi:hypothetical protein